MHIINALNKNCTWMAYQISNEIPAYSDENGHLFQSMVISGIG
jgi:hypothetical protein